MDFAVPADHRVNFKGTEKIDNLDGELKKQWNMEVTEIPLGIGELGTVTKGLVLGLGGLGNNRMSEDHPI